MGHPGARGESCDDGRTHFKRLASQMALLHRKRVVVLVPKAAQASLAVRSCGNPLSQSKSLMCYCSSLLIPAPDELT